MAAQIQMEYSVERIPDTRLGLAEMDWWVPVQSMPARAAASYSDVYIRSAYAQQKKGFFGTEPDRRLMAIILGIARSAMTSFYVFETTDMDPREVAKPVYKFIPGDNGSSSTEDMIVVDPNADPSMSEEAQAMADFTDAERDIMVTLKKVSVAIPALQGRSLFITGCNYRSTDNPGRKAFDAVERQLFAETKLKSWLYSNLDIFRATAWVKSGHPLRDDIKISLGRRKWVAEMLREAGLSSAARRLPAKESSLKAAETFRSLCERVATVIRTYGGKLSVNLKRLNDVIDLVDMFPMDGSTPPNFQLPDKFEFSVDERVLSAQFTSVVNRTTAIELLEKVLDKNKVHFPCMCAFYTGLINDIDTLPEELEELWEWTPKWCGN
ncbi:unnamed protein product [Calypogeia fissa]